MQCCGFSMDPAVRANIERLAATCRLQQSQRFYSVILRKNRTLDLIYVARVLLHDL
jgi:hypothetical protein